MFGSLIGTSTTTSYIESAAGVSAGGRTGLTAAFVSLFFLLALFFAPLAGMIPAYATSAALLYVACVMARGLAEIDWDDITEYAPAVVDGHHHAADLFDRHRHRPRLHHLCAGEDPGRQVERGLAGGDGAGGAVCDQIRGDGLDARSAREQVHRRRQPQAEIARLSARARSAPC